MLALILCGPGLVRSLGRVSSRPALVASGRGHPLMLLDLAVAADLPSTLLSTSAVTLGETLPSAALAFADQADNAAGPLFAGSLAPYLVFLYFVCQDVNGLDRTAKAGFASLLAFVAATVIASNPNPNPNPKPNPIPNTLTLSLTLTRSSRASSPRHSTARRSRTSTGCTPAAS